MRDDGAQSLRGPPRAWTPELTWLALEHLYRVVPSDADRDAVAAVASSLHAASLLPPHSVGGRGDAPRDGGDARGGREQLRSELAAVGNGDSAASLLQRLGNAVLAERATTSPGGWCATSLMALVAPALSPARAAAGGLPRTVRTGVGPVALQVRAREVCGRRAGAIALSPAVALRGLRPVRWARGHNEAVYCATFDSTGALLVTAADDGLAKVWCAESGWLLHSLRGHSSDVTDVSISHGDTLLATASNDGTVRVWAFSSAADASPCPACLAVLRVQAPVLTADWRPAGWMSAPQLLTTDVGGSARLWTCPPPSDWGRETPSESAATKQVRITRLTGGSARDALGTAAATLAQSAPLSATFGTLGRGDIIAAARRMAWQCTSLPLKSVAGFKYQVRACVLGVAGDGSAWGGHHPRPTLAGNAPGRSAGDWLRVVR